MHGFVDNLVAVIDVSRKGSKHAELAEAPEHTISRGLAPSREQTERKKLIAHKGLQSLPAQIIPPEEGDFENF